MRVGGGGGGGGRGGGGEWKSILGTIIAVGFFNEYLIFHLAALKCGWECGQNGCSKSDLKAFMISDTHLLGIVNGHWFDKLKREWQMYRSYQSAVTWHQPDAVFFLGDLLDEGQWAGRKQFRVYSQRFRQLFGDSSSSQTAIPRIYALAGNHDVGFHYAMSPETIRNFENEFNQSLIDEIYVKNYRFILINSMILHGDGCRLCWEAEKKLKEMSATVASSKRPPIVLQHFPLFRKSDDECEESPEFGMRDSQEKYREQWEVLSKKSTNLIVELNPRAVFNGHTHKMCKKRWAKRNGFFNEYTVNSFSWRNGDQPALLMVVISNDEDVDISVTTCWLPSENVQIFVYIIAAIYIVLRVVWRNLPRRSFTKFSYHNIVSNGADEFTELKIK